MCVCMCVYVCVYVCMCVCVCVCVVRGHKQKKALFHLSTLPLILFRFSLPLPFTETNGFAIQESPWSGAGRLL